MPLRHALSRTPRVKHAVHRSVDRTAGAVARGLCRPGRGRLPLDRIRGATFTETGSPAWAEVRGPRAAIDERPGDFHRICEAAAQGYELSAAGIALLEDARFQAPGGIVSVGGRFPEELVPLAGFPYSWQLLPAARTLWSRPAAIPDGYLLGLQLAHSYYHWTCEILPLAQLIVEDDPEGRLPIYLGAQLPGFVAEHLRMLRLADRVQRLPSGVYTAGRLRVPVAPGGAEWPSPDHLRAVRARLLTAAGTDPGGREAGRRLLISRDDAGDRRITNEAELLRTLEPLGFERLALSGLSAVDQIRTFRSAEIIVAPHGGGLANILFAPADCRIIELLGTRHVSACFMLMASALGQPYGYAACQDVGRDLLVDPRDVTALIDALEHPPRG